jgi:hypothetical protein
MKESAKLHRSKKNVKRRILQSDCGEYLGEGQFAHALSTKPGDISMKTGAK